EVDVPVAGIVVADVNGIQISNNRFSITANSNGDAGAGIIATDFVPGGWTHNLTVINNDGRGSAYDLIITSDLFGGTGNSAGGPDSGQPGDQPDQQRDHECVQPFSPNGAAL